MFRLLLVSTVLACALASQSPIKQRHQVPLPGNRVVGIEDASILNFPYLVSLLWYGSHICAGATIAPRYVVTIAQCTEGEFASQYSIRAGSSLRNSGGVVVQVSVIYQHPNFNYWTLDYDISVIGLASPLIFGPGIGAIDLPHQGQPIPVGVDCVVTGWSKSSQVSQAVNMTTVCLEDCILASGWDDVTERMMCAGPPEDDKDACQGGGGSPLSIGTELIGMASWSWGCRAPNLPNIYTSIPALRFFIKNTVGI